MINKHQISDLILDHNNQFIVAVKPSGMASAPDQTGHANLKNMLEAYSKHDLHIITRTDRPVSGLSLFAKSQNAARNLSNQIKENKISKSYLAIVEKAPKEESGELVHYLFKGRSNKSIVVEETHKAAKKSILTYSTVAKLDNYTVLKIELKTGRFHQIRSQCSFLGHPIKGDVKYGARRANKNRQIHLHSSSITFSQVDTGEVSYRAELPKNDDLWALVSEKIKNTDGEF